jgi:hypothetical protein
MIMKPILAGLLAMTILSAVPVVGQEEPGGVE